MLTAGSEALRFDDLHIVREGSGRPQRLSGSAVTGLAGGQASRIDLSSPYLDADSLAGPPASARGPLEAVTSLLASSGSLPDLGQAAEFAIAIEELTLGGGRVEKVSLAAVRTPDGLKIDRADAKLPGHVLLSASGTLGNLGAPHFDGHVRLWGTELTSFANWIGPSLRLPVTAGASTFLIDTSLSADAGRVSAEQMRLELSGTTITGTIRHVAEPRSISVKLDGDKLDLTRQVDVPALLALLAGAAPAPEVRARQRRKARGRPWSIRRPEALPVG